MRSLALQMGAKTAAYRQARQRWLTQAIEVAAAELGVDADEVRESDLWIAKVYYRLPPEPHLAGMKLDRRYGPRGARYRN